MKRHILIEECRVAQPQGAVLLVVIELLPQRLRPLPNRLAVGYAQQIHHLLLRLAVRQLRQHPQRHIQAYRGIHLVPFSGENNSRRFVTELPQCLRVHPVLRFPCRGMARLRNGILSYSRTAAARQHQRRQQAAQHHPYLFHLFSSLFCSLHFNNVVSPIYVTENSAKRFPFFVLHRKFSLCSFTFTRESVKI